LAVYKMIKGWPLLLLAGATYTIILAVSVMFLNRPSANTLMDQLKKQYARPADIPFPENNPYSAASALLGKTLFFDTRLSHSGVMSCASCHNPGFSWTDGNPKGVGNRHQILARKTPTLLNLTWDELFFWDGRAEDLEHQARGPIEAADEMNMPLTTAVIRLKGIAEYHPLFARAFPDEPEAITQDNITRAIATYMRTIVSGTAPFDRWIQGDENAISPAAKRGFMIFNIKGNCASCHSGWRFSDGSFHDIGLKDDDIGRGKLVPLPIMQHAFKTVGLRNIDRRAPYMHDGSQATLMEVVEHYDHGFITRESLADDIRPLHLTQQEKKDLVTYLQTLTSEDEPVTIPSMPQ
jgi:cytochrome c peroxidase